MDTITAVNAVLALTPVFIVLGAFLWLDVFHLLSWRSILLLLAFGGLAAVVSYPISGRALDALPLGFSNYSRFVAPWVEEGLKGSIIVFLFLRNKIGFKIDAALSGLAIGAGFAVVENLFYLTQVELLSPGIWLVRGAGTAVMHSGTLAILATLAHQFNEHDLLVRTGEWKFHPFAFVPGYLAAVGLHTAFNQFPDRPLIPMVVTIVFVPIATILVFRLGMRQASDLLEVERQQHLVDQPALEAGQLPETDDGRRLREFLARLGEQPALTRLVIEYWRVLGEIVLSAEERLMERGAGQRVDAQADIDRARLKRLADLEGRFDYKMLRRVKRLLPFSRNDYWEVDELRQQLHRS
jgi:RsiW-degrading membrane proteinase PrsW (M82 family)